MKKYGNINLGINKQKNKYQNRFDNELIKFYSLNINIDQIDNLLYPKKVIYMKSLLKKVLRNLNIILIHLNLTILFVSIQNQELNYMEMLFLEIYLNSKLSFQKSIIHFPYDRTLAFSEYNLIATNLTSYGIEFNIDYKNSTTVRILYNYINNVDFKHNNQSINNLNSYGLVSG